MPAHKTLAEVDLHIVTLRDYLGNMMVDLLAGLAAKASRLPDDVVKQVQATRARNWRIRTHIATAIAEIGKLASNSAQPQDDNRKDDDGTKEDVAKEPTKDHGHVLM